VPLERDTVRRVEAEFGPQSTAKAIEVLTAAGQSGRLARCIVHLAKGDLAELERYIRLEKEDYRDIVMAAEYDDMRRCVRDLRASFLIDSREKMWIGDLAAALSSRGFFLESVQAGTMDSGLAVFDGDLGKLVIKKDRGQWILEGETDELDLYDLRRAYDDERQFSDAVSCYVLAKQNPKKSVPRDGTGC
jgi:hypothetical protein